MSASDLFPLLSTNEIFNILNTQLNYKMITLDLLNTVNNKNTSTSSNAIISFYKNFIFDYQLSDNINNNIKLLKFLQFFFTFLGINDFNMLDLYNCNSLDRLHRSLSCIINFIRFSQERLKNVNNLIMKINIQSKLDIIDNKLTYILNNEDTNDLNELELNYKNKLKVLNISNNNKVNELNQQINESEKELEKLNTRYEELNGVINVLDSDVINDLLVKKISQNIISLKKNLNSLKNDHITINELKITINKNEQELTLLSNNQEFRIDDDAELNDIHKIQQLLSSLKSFINLESSVAFNINNINDAEQELLNSYIPQWKNIVQRKQNLIHLENNNIIPHLNKSYNEINNFYNNYKNQILNNYDLLIQEINDYVSNIIEYL